MLQQQVYEVLAKNLTKRRRSSAKSGTIDHLLRLYKNQSGQKRTLKQEKRKRKQIFDKLQAESNVSTDQMVTDTRQLIERTYADYTDLQKYCQGESSEERLDTMPKSEENRERLDTMPKSEECDIPQFENQKLQPAAGKPMNSDIYSVQ